jgi:hypothetical protein
MKASGGAKAGAGLNCGEAKVNCGDLTALGALASARRRIAL